MTWVNLKITINPLKTDLGGHINAGVRIKQVEFREKVGAFFPQG